MPRPPIRSSLPAALSHGDIMNIVEGIFFVFGTNIVMHQGIRIKTSRTMTIIRDGRDLTLVNSIRLDENGLRTLESLGHIKNVIRLGAFHGRDDAFYQKVYNAKLFAYPEMDFDHGEVLDYDLRKSRLPVSQARIIEFKTTRFKEALLLLDRSGGILISCDSIKNWQSQDQFFDNETFAMMKIAGSIGPAKIDSTWLQAMTPSKEEIQAIGDLDFAILMSAHGPPLISEAKKIVSSSINEALQQMP